MKKRIARKFLFMLLTLTMVVSLFAGIPQTAMAEDIPAGEPALGFGLETGRVLDGNSESGMGSNKLQTQLEIGETSKSEPEEVLEQSLMAVNASPEEDFEFDEATGTIFGYVGEGGAVVIPETIGGVAVTKIYDSIFWVNPSLTSIIIPGSVTSMGDNPFYGCESLQEINVDEDNNNYSSLDGVLFNKTKTELMKYPEGKVQTAYVIPDSVTSIGDWAFYDCDSLTSISIPSSVNGIGECAFHYCSNLASINIPGSVTSISDYAFYYCSSLISINIPSSVTSIGDYAFWGCDSLTNIDIPNGVTSIGFETFAGCSNLTSIAIPSSVASIGNHAFLYCESLQEINVDEDNKSYSSLDGVLFDETKTVFIKYPEGKVQTEYVIPDSVTSIYYSAFKNCSSLTCIAIPNSVTDILGAAFENCPSLTSINIPNSVTGISAGTFRGCNSLTSIEIPSGVTSIGMRAFQYCSSLTSITIPSSVTSIIGDEVFSECNNLTIYGEDNSYAKTYAEVNNIPFSIIPGGIPASAFPAIIKQPESKAVLEGISITLTVEAESTDGGTLTYQWQKDGIDIPGAAGTSYTINSAASTDEGSYRVIVTNTMSGCTPATIASNVAVLTLVVVSPDEDFEFEESTGTITGYRGPGGAVVIPETIGGVAVTKIGDYAFEECSSLISIDIPGSVISIGRWAFYNCDSLTIINIPNGVTSIDDFAFYNCFSLISINIPNGVTSISDWVFYNCMSLTSITIPNGVTKIGKDAFFNCKNLTSINIPSSVTYVDINPFRNCESLQEINVDAGNVNYFSLEGVLFCEYKSGTSLAIYPGGKFQTEYVIPSTVKGISCYAFFNCENLNSINIPDGLTYISTYAFQGCSSLTSINIPNNLKYINEAVFLGCSSLKSIYIPNSVTSIGRYAFKDCSGLTNINIPSSVTDIDDYAFRYCSNLAWAKFEGNAPNNFGDYVFAGCAPDFIIYYYKGATGFTNPWHGYPTEAIDGGPTDEGQNYYSNTRSKYFRVVDPTSSSYPQPSGFGISANDTNYNTGTTNDIKINISDSYKNDIIISKPEYHSYTFPNDFIADYNWITLYPVTVQTPFVQAALVDKSTANYKSLDNIIINNETIYENTMGTTKLYVDVNWNGSSPGTIYLKQDSKIVALSEGFNYLTLGTSFIASGGDIFLCMKTADGTVYSQKININVYKKLQTINLDLGESVEVDVPNEVEAIGGTKLKLDFTDLSKGVIPIELDISDDGTVKGTIGLGVPDAKKKTYAFGTIKDAFQVFRNGSASDEDISKAIKSMLSNDYIKPAGNYASFGIKADVHVIGYFEGNILDGRLGLTSADMVLIVKGQFSHSQVLYYGGMPFYYEAGLKTKIETGIGMEYDELLNELTARNDQSSSGNLQLFGGGGIGAPEVISGGARFTGGITMEGVWPYDSNNAVWYMDGKGSFVGTLFGQKGEWTVLQSGKLYIWENGEAFPYGFSSQSKSSLMMNDDEWSQPSREYLSSQSEFVANDMSISLYSRSGSQTISEVFKTNTYTYTDPQYVTFENGTELLVWVDDDSNRIIDENRTALYFSYNNGSNWTEPAIVWQDSTADFNPSLKVIDDTAYLIWINSNTEFIGGESLVEIAEATEIAYACFEPGSTSFVDTANISNNSGLNMLADVTVIHGAPMGVWVNNSANDVYCSRGTTSIQSASFQGSTWTAEELATELDAIDGLIINNEDNSLKVWFSQDTDSDVTTTDDKEIFQLEGNTLTQYTHNDIADTKPQYANGLYWYSGGDIIFENTDTQIKAISDHFQVQAGNNGIDVITYESTDDEGDSVIYAIYNDGSGWGEPVAIVEPDKYIVSYSAALRSDGSLSIIANESTIESDDSLGNADLSFYRVIPTCNLAVNGAAYDPHSFIPDKKLDVMIDLENYGAIAVDSFDVVFMNGGTQVDTITKSMELASGQQGVLLVECQLPSIIDFEEIDITVTPSNEIDDALIDNTATIQLRLKDISVEEVYAEKYADTVIVTARVVNRGQTSLSNINLSLRADTEDGTLIASDSISGLESQDVEIVTFTTSTLLENDIVYIVADEQPEENILSNNSNLTMVRTLSMAINTSPEEDFEFDETTGTITGYNGSGGAVVIPETIGGVAVTIIGDEAFDFCVSLTSIDIPSNVTSIGVRAFSGCEGLTSITIPSSVSSIGDGVFSGCDNLTIYGEENSYAQTYAEDNSITFSIISGGSGGGASPSTSPVIIKQPEDKTVVLGSSITLTVEAESTDGGTLTYRWIKDGVEIPGAVSTSYTINSAASTDEGSYRVIVTNRMSGSSPAIVASDVAVLTVVVDASPEEDFEFDEATGTITGYYGSGGAVVMPETIGGIAVTAIGEEAFSYCYDLTSIKIPGSVTSIGEWAFQNCSSLTSMNIPGCVTSIGRSAFENCESLTSIEIPSSVTSIGYAAFWRCNSLQEINVDEANNNYSSLDGVLFNETKTEIVKYPGKKVGTHYAIPSSVTSIGEWAFHYCESLTSIAIPSSVTSISDYAFYECSSLTSISIPSSVAIIGDETFYDDEVFYGCDNLTIYGENNSYAQTYAEKYSIPFTIISGGSSALPVIIKQPERKTVLEGSSITLTIEAESTDGGTLTYQWKKDGVDISGATGTSYTINSAASTDQGSYIVIVTNTVSGSAPTTVASNGAVLTVVVDAPDFEFDRATGTITGFRGPGGAVVIPETIGGVAVTSIGYEAFYNCDSLTSITIPSSVTSIGEGAFDLCVSLQEINVDEANNNYSSLNGVLFNEAKTELMKYPSNKVGTQYTIPSSVTSIGERAFQYSKSLTSINIQGIVTSIGSGAFENCESLTSIAIPSSVTSISADAFFNCVSLQEINVDEANNKYSSLDGVLFNKAKIELRRYPSNKVGTQYAIPSSVTSIGEWAFERCASLTSIVIPSSVTSIRDYAFICCYNLTSITIPSSVTSIGDETFYSDEVFSGCDNLTIYGENNSYAQTYAEKYSIPFSIISSALPVIKKQPESKTVLEGSSITLTVEAESTDGGTLTYQWQKDGIDIPGAAGTSYTINSAASIDEGSYRVVVTNTMSGSTPATIASNVAVLTVALDAPDFEFDVATGNITGYNGSGGAVVIPETIGGVAVTAIGDSAFYNCDSLTSINISSSVTSIGHSAFQDCNSLTSINIPEGVTSIGDETFQACMSLKSINIPGSVTSIGFWTFQNCYSLQEINVDEDNNNYSSLDGVLFNETKTELMKYPGNKVGTEYAIPSSVTSMGLSAFTDGRSLTSINIPGSVTSIGFFAFHCDSLLEINVDEDNNNYSSLEGVLFNKTKTTLMEYPSDKVQTEYAIPNGVTSISDFAFYDCDSLTSINIPEGVTIIGDGAFESCSSLTSINIPSSVTSIGECAFFDCYNLTSITIPSSVTSIGDSAFYGCNNLTIYGEDNSYSQTYAEVNSIPFSIKQAANTDATLKQININGVALSGFESTNKNYSIELPYGTAAIPEVTATANDSNAKIVITPTTVLPGITAVKVTAEDGIASNAYSINFTVAAPKNTDATLSDLKVDGTTIADFAPSTLDYNIMLPTGTSVVPTVTAVANDTGKANIVVTPATTFPGTTTVLVTAEDGLTAKTYTINFTVVQSVTVTTNLPDVAVNHNPLQILIPSDVNNAALIATPVDGQVTLPQVDVQSETSLGTVRVLIPAGNQVTGPSNWNGTINLPQVREKSSVTIPSAEGETASVSTVIEIGLPDTELTFSQPVRIVLSGQGGKKVGWIRNSTFTPITFQMTTDSADDLGSNNDGFITIDNDLVIWTKHFTTFVAYTETVAEQTATPKITGTPTETDTSVSGTALPGASVVLCINGTNQPAVMTDASTGAWTVGGLTLSSGDNISVTAQVTGKAVSAATTATVTNQIDECFIATAAFGSKFTWPVALLRHFRDQYLLTNSVGTAFVNFYYKYSPPIAAFIAGSQPLKVLVRVLLAPVIAIVYMIYHPMLMVIALFIIFLICLYCLRRRYVQA